MSWMRRPCLYRLYRLVGRGDEEPVRLFHQHQALLREDKLGVASERHPAPADDLRLHGWATGCALANRLALPDHLLKALPRRLDQGLDATHHRRRVGV